MSNYMITMTDDMSVYKSADGVVYIVTRQRFAEDPEDVVNDYRLFAYAQRGFIGVTGFEPFDTILNYGVAHEEFPTTEELPELFSGGLCRSFKCKGWEGHDFRIEDDIAYCVSRELGTAEEWSRYPAMAEDELVWKLTDTSNGVVLTDIYADSPREAVELFLEQGDSASLKARVDSVLGRG